MSVSSPPPSPVAHSDRVAGWVGVVVAVITLLYAYLQIAHYALLEAGITLFVAAVLLCLAPLSNRFSFGALHYVSAVLFVAIGIVAFLRGGLVYAVVPFGLAAPIGASAVARPRAAGFWLAMMIPLSACLHLLERYGLTPRKVEATTGAALVAAWSCVAVLTALVLIQERVRSSDVAVTNTRGYGRFKTCK